jgi:hypothetical protein
MVRICEVDWEAKTRQWRWEVNVEIDSSQQFCERGG